jgi:heterodisulfide reductase subunit A
MGEKRVGVYVCNCGLNIAGTVNVKEVAEYASSLPNVVVGKEYIFACSDPGQEMIKNDIRDLGLNRIVVAACSPHMHERTFRRAVREAGLNPYLFQIANIREQCSWVHDEGATDKAKDMVRAAVMRVAEQEPLVAVEFPIIQSALVVGGGIAGIQATLDIANAGYQVYLVEKDPSIGGHMIQLDKTFPTLDCSACITTPKMSDVGSHPNIELLTHSEVEEVSGYIGNFTVKIKKKARSVNMDLCTGCGACQEKCPAKAPSEFDQGLGTRKAIYTPFAQAVPHKPVIDRDHCTYFQKGKCRICEKVCPAGAIDYEQQNETFTVNTGAIVITTGYDPFDPTPIRQYGYGVFDNVYTGLEFERLNSATGPTGGQIALKNGKVPESVAIIHCVGSRDKNYHEYCSRVCCMAGLKFAHLVREKTGADIYQLYIDMRCFGEGYEEFYERVSTEDGVKFIRGKAARVTDLAVTDEEKGKLTVSVEDTLLSTILRVPVDMVILLTALEAKTDAEIVARTFSISRRADGFFLERHVKLDPVATMTDGIFVAGCCESPKDIPDTVSQADAAAARVLSLFAQGKTEIEPIITVVDEDVCAGCGLCVEVCPYGAPSIIEPQHVSRVNEALCKGCGACAGTCPSGAIRQRHFTYREILDEVEAFVDGA